MNGILRIITTISGRKVNRCCLFDQFYLTSRHKLFMHHFFQLKGLLKNNPMWNSKLGQVPRFTIVLDEKHSSVTFFLFISRLKFE